jgi:hypothetical protein
MVKASPTQRLSPLWIVSLFLSLTEVVLGFAVTRTDGWVQGLLAIFVVAFGLGVAAAFFYVLWHKPRHFYYAGDCGRKEFISAIRGGPREILTAIESVGNDPTDHTALYRFLDCVLDASIKQHLILLEKGAQLPYLTSCSFRYEFGTQQQDWKSGMLDGRRFQKGLDGTGLIEVVTAGGAPSKIQITKAGRKFVEWLVQEGRKAEYFDCDLGGWGTPFDPFEALNRTVAMDIATGAVNEPQERDTRRQELLPSEISPRGRNGIDEYVIGGRSRQ